MHYRILQKLKNINGIHSDEVKNDSRYKNILSEMETLKFQADHKKWAKNSLKKIRTESTDTYTIVDQEL